MWWVLRRMHMHDVCRNAVRQFLHPFKARCSLGIIVVELCTKVRNLRVRKCSVDNFLVSTYICRSVSKFFIFSQPKLPLSTFA